MPDFASAISRMAMSSGLLTTQTLQVLQLPPSSRLRMLLVSTPAISLVLTTPLILSQLASLQETSVGEPSQRLSTRPLLLPLRLLDAKSLPLLASASAIRRTDGSCQITPVLLTAPGAVNARLSAICLETKLTLVQLFMTNAGQSLELSPEQSSRIAPLVSIELKPISTSLTSLQDPILVCKGAVSQRQLDRDSVNVKATGPLEATDLASPPATELVSKQAPEQTNVGLPPT